MYDIIVRFPSEEMAKQFCREMSDGFGEGLCDFSPSHKIPDPDNPEKFLYERITSSAPEGTPVFFVRSIEEF